VRTPPLPGLRANAAALADVASSMESGLAASQRRALDINAAVFAALSAAFADLTSSLLPGLAFRLLAVETGEPERGVALQFRRLPDGEWAAALEQLSGGQRALLSLALLLAAARSSGGRSSVVLLDEVRRNRARAAHALPSACTRRTAFLIYLSLSSSIQP
jgi:chromosome segregation ATPase